MTEKVFRCAVVESLDLTVRSHSVELGMSELHREE